MATKKITPPRRTTVAPTTKTYRAETVAGYLLMQQTGDVKVTNIQLQALLYAAQGYTLARYNHRLFSDPIESWEESPTVATVALRYGPYGEEPLPKPESFNKHVLDPEARATLDEVWALHAHNYQYRQAVDAKAWRQSNPPWNDAPRGTVISTEAMKTYFFGMLGPRHSR
jgi:uncharacterized phage-associated protein